MSTKVAFCRLDARDDYLTRYSTTGFYDTDEDRPIEPISAELGKVAVFLEREYLTRIKALQDELADKYEKLAREIKTHTLVDPDFVYGYGLEEADFFKAEKEAKREFPGEEAEYYT